VFVNITKIRAASLVNYDEPSSSSCSQAKRSRRSERSSFLDHDRRRQFVGEPSKIAGEKKNFSRHFAKKIKI